MCGSVNLAPSQFRLCCHNVKRSKKKRLILTFRNNFALSVSRESVICLLLLKSHTPDCRLWGQKLNTNQITPSSSCSQLLFITQLSIYNLVWKPFFTECLLEALEHCKQCQLCSFIVLSEIRVEGATEVKLKIFFSVLCHRATHPNKHTTPLRRLCIWVFFSLTDEAWGHNSPAPCVKAEIDAPTYSVRVTADKDMNKDPGKWQKLRVSQAHDCSREPWTEANTVIRWTCVNRDFSNASVVPLWKVLLCGVSGWGLSLSHWVHCGSFASPEDL